MKKPAVVVTITGGAGQIGAHLAFRIASGSVFGEDQPITLHLLEIPAALHALKGVAMELEDCAFPLLERIVPTSRPEEAFDNCHYAILVGSKPRSAGMERKDLILENAPIFSSQGQVANRYAKKDVKVLVVANPANTNALVFLHNAPSINPTQVSAMTRLDHNRAVAQLAKESRSAVCTIKKVAIWGNHSSTQYPDLSHATIGGRPAFDLVDRQWARDVFVQTVQQRGAAVIAARGSSSVPSAVNAISDHMHDWVLGTSPTDWISMGVLSQGEYGMGDDIVYSYPVTCSGGSYKIVTDLLVDTYSREKMAVTARELREERDAVSHLL